MAHETVKEIQDGGVEFVDFRFTDPLGQWHHFTMPAGLISESHFKDGIMFDGSSIRCFQPIHKSDMVLLPVPENRFIDPFTERSTMVLFCNVLDGITKEPYSRDPRRVAKRAEAYLAETGLAEQAYFGPEPEFYVFDDIRFKAGSHNAFYEIQCSEGPWNSAMNNNPNMGYRPRATQGYSPTPPTDHFHDLRSEMATHLMACGMEVEMLHHEVGAAGQAEIDIKYGTLLDTADRLAAFKYIIRQTAQAWGHTATFMPKPIYKDNGSGMHVHVSLWKDGHNLFHDTSGYAGLSEMALHFIGGLLRHAPSLCAICNPTTNSYRRLVPGYEAPIFLAYSHRNRSACVRVPLVSSEAATRIEYRTPDPASNGYLCFPAILMAGLDGIRNQISPHDPVDKNLYEMDPHDLGGILNTPADLGEALVALKEDHEYLLEGGVFTEDLVQSYIAYKEDEEWAKIRLRPHPQEFRLYYDI